MRYDLVNSTKQVDLGTLTWQEGSVPHRFFAVVNDMPVYNDTRQRIYCNFYAVKYANEDKTIYQTWQSSTVAIIVVNDVDYDTPAQFKVAMSGKILTYVSADEPRRFDIVKGSEFNQWDEDFIAGKYYDENGNLVTNVNAIASKNIYVLDKTTYYFKNPNNSGTAGIRILFYDINNSLMGSQVFGLSTLFTTPLNTYYIKFSIYNYNSTTYKNDICINISQPDTSKSPHNGDYRPYTPKRFNFVNNTAQVDLGSLTYIKRDDPSGRQIFVTLITDIVPEVSGSTVIPAWCDGYNRTTRNVTWKNLDMAYTTQDVEPYRHIAFVNNSYQTSETFKAAMSGHILTYQSTQKETK